MTKQIVAKLATEIIQKSNTFYNECTQQGTGTQFPINFEMTKLGRMVVVELYMFNHNGFLNNFSEIPNECLRIK